QRHVLIEGRVIAEDGRIPVASAEVRLMQQNGRVLQRTETRADGKFDFSVRPVPAMRLHVQRQGYKTTTTPLLLLDHRTYFQVEVTLDTEAVLLAPLEVLAWSEVSTSPFLDNFRRRVGNGMGIYITRADIEERRPVLVSDLLRTVPGVSVESAGSGTRPVVTFGRARARDCVTQIFVDGFLANRRVPGGSDDVRLDDMVSPGSVEGIEIYRGRSTIPPEFLNADASCGVIAVWTRRGEPMRR
ncbi:MAG: TonB-dependent receptor, partial [Longimicrobiales bacterium]